MKNIFHNWHLKLLSLLTAIVLWFFVVGSENTVYRFPQSIQIVPTNMSDNLAIAEPLPPITVYVKAKKEVIEAMTASEIHIELNASKLSVGPHEIPLVATLNNPQAAIVKIEPKTVKIRVVPKTEKEVDIKLVWQGNPAKNFVVKELKSEVIKAKITGPENLLSDIKEVEGVFVFNGSEEKDTIQKVPLTFLQDPELAKENFDIEPQEIQVNAIIVPAELTKSIPITPEFINMENQEKFLSKLLTTPSTLNITGVAEAMAGIESITTVPLEINNFENGTLTAQLKLPPNVEVEGGVEKVQLALPENYAIRELQARFVITRQGNPVIQSIEPASAKVKLFGLQTVLDKLDGRSITVNINGEKAEGSVANIQAADIIVPPSLQVLEYEPKQVKLVR